MAISPDATPEVVARISGFDEELALNLAGYELFEVAGANEDPVQTILLTPKSDGPHPLLFWIHGGPIGQHADQWHWRWNALIPLSRGYAVALPNPRGSTGRGQAFIEGIWGNAWGADCYDDLMAVADELEKRDAIDENQSVAMGGSFGGYMTNWIGTQTQRFQCLVTHASIYHFSMFYGVTDYPAWWAFEKGLHPHDDLDAFEKYSPHRYIENWRTPTLIIHGEKDYRVPIGEALALFEDLQAREVPSELLVFPDENHWILKPRNIVEWYNRFLAFTDETLGR